MNKMCFYIQLSPNAIACPMYNEDGWGKTLGLNQKKMELNMLNAFHFSCNSKLKPKTQRMCWLIAVLTLNRREEELYC